MLANYKYIQTHSLEEILGRSVVGFLLAEKSLHLRVSLVSQRLLKLSLLICLVLVPLVHLCPLSRSESLNVPLVARLQLLQLPLLGLVVSRQFALMPRFQHLHLRHDRKEGEF